MEESTVCLIKLLLGLVKVKERKMKNFIPLASEARPVLEKRNKASWIFLLFLLFFVPFNSHAEDKKPIGQVISAVGTVKATSADKTERPLKRGASIFTLETIVVNEASKVQLKFTDGGLINLIEKTEYRVESYIFKELDKKSEAVSTLVKGGFRALSGAIAKENPTGTQVRTAVAAMGLRGTRFEAILNNDKLSAACDQGKIAVSNDKGEVEIGPSSNTLFSTVAEGEAPMPSTEMPPELAAVEASGAFDVEGGEALDESAAAGEAEGEEGGEGEAEEEPLTEDSDEGSDETSDDESEEPEPEESEEDTGEETAEETEQESEEDTPEEETTYDEVEGENLTEEEAAQQGEAEEEAPSAEGEEGTQAEEGTQPENEEGTQAKESGEGAEGTAGEEGGQAQSQTGEEGAGSESGTSETSGSGSSESSEAGGGGGGGGDLGGGGSSGGGGGGEE